MAKENIRYYVRSFHFYCNWNSLESLLSSKSTWESMEFGISDSDIKVVRRNSPGTKREDWCNWPEMNFDEMDSTLNVQMFIQQTIRKDPSNVTAILTPPKGQDEAVWKYEHLRQFCMELNGLAVLLQRECDPAVCSQMAATEQWIYLCAAHKNPKECTAIDYIRHTLDGAACLLTNNKYFPSRISIKDASVAKLGSVCRRVYRIFSHAYFNHKSLFDEFERKTHLCRRFTLFVIKYNLMIRDHLIIPKFDDIGLQNISVEQQQHVEPVDLLNETTCGVGAV
ncbi:MOB-like protein phocein [Trichinella murrelli]|uniref:MOB-like protein phocein n=1 Tax=Trichinella murrelli TaxID=144512 RepID=A0A0V0TVH3_9BILA|nr:MOB-like protein phocein [Trichinella murrelli]